MQNGRIESLYQPYFAPVESSAFNNTAVTKIVSGTKHAVALLSFVHFFSDHFRLAHSGRFVQATVLFIPGVLAFMGRHAPRVL